MQLVTDKKVPGEQDFVESIILMVCLGAITQLIVVFGGLQTTFWISLVHVLEYVLPQSLM